MKKLAVALVFAAIVAGTVPARANVGVHLLVNAGHFAAPGVVADCNVSVPAGSDGIAVLGAAKSSGCIDSYQYKTFSFGRQIVCIDDICETPDPLTAVTWLMTENGKCTDYGVDLFQANAGDTLGFTFTQWGLIFVC